MYWLLIAIVLGATDPSSVSYGPYKSMKECRQQMVLFEIDAETELRRIKADEQRMKELEEEGLQPEEVVNIKFKPLCIEHRVDFQRDYVLIAYNETQKTQEVVLKNLELVECLNIKDSLPIKYIVAERAILYKEHLLLGCAWFSRNSKTYSEYKWSQR